MTTFNVLLRGTAWLSLVSVLAFATTSCGGDGNNANASANTAPLSVDEQQFIQFTREEEKLARDVYTKLDALHPSFSNIKASEQTHMDAVNTLLSRYSVTDPAAGKDVGVFTNVALQKLYTELVAIGTTSQLAALQVGVEIEELDIADIERGRTKLTHTDITNTMDNLTRGSRNHLRTFYSALKGLGGDYTPKHLDKATFEGIVTSSKETGPS